MKSALFAKLLVLTAALAIAFTPGCRRKSKEPITPLQAGRTGAGINNPRAAGPDSSGALGPGSGLDGTGLNNGGVSTTPITPETNIGQGDGPLDRTAFNEDRAQFAANVVYFDFDSAVVKSSEKSKLTAVADYLRTNPSAAVEVEGHCDERGTEEYNRSLGDRRALSLREELALSGIDPKRVYTISYGEDRPAVVGQGESAWAKNRRGEFVLLTPR